MLKMNVVNKTRLVAILLIAFVQLVAVHGSARGEEQTVQAEQAAKTRYYSSQSFVYLDPGETHLFKLKNGTLKSLRLKSVRESKDSVIGLVRRAEVRVELDGQPLAVWSNNASAAFCACQTAFALSRLRC